MERPRLVSPLVPWFFAATSVASADGPTPCEKYIRPTTLGTINSPTSDGAHHRPGRVVVTFLVSADGAVSNVKVVESNDAWYNDSAIETVSQFKFARRSSSCQGQYTVQFTLR